MTDPQFHDITQNTPEWLKLRLGVFTASSIGKLLTAKGAIADNETSRGLINRLARERMSGRPDAQRETWDMARGHEMEPVAREYYTRHYAPVAEVGFVTNTIDGVAVGCSPDGLVGEDGGIQIKSRNEAIHFAEVLSGEVPAGDLPQIQFELMVTGRAWWDYVSFCDGWPLLVIRVLPDPVMQATLRQAIVKADADVRAVILAYSMASLGLHPTEKIPDADNLSII